MLTTWGLHSRHPDFWKKRTQSPERLRVQFLGQLPSSKRVKVAFSAGCAGHRDERLIGVHQWINPLDWEGFVSASVALYFLVWYLSHV